MRIVRQLDPNPETGMHDMGFALEPGDRVVLITGEDHQVLNEPMVITPGDREVELHLPYQKRRLTSLGWGVLDHEDRVVVWQWIPPGDFLEWCRCVSSTITVTLDTCSPDVRSALN